MKAWMVHEFGTYREQLKLEECEPPKPGRGAATMQVHSASAIFADLLCIAGQYQIKHTLPFTPGFEAAGVVLEAGEGSRFKPGDRVIAANARGAWTERMLLDTGNEYLIHDGMSDSEASAFVINYLTSYFGLAHKGRLQAGETLLVLGAAGGVGTAAIQIGKALGAEVIAAAGSAEKLEICRRCGADHAINYVEDDLVSPVKDLTGGRGADVVYDPVGSDVFDLSTRCIAVDGRIVVVGFAGGRIPEIRVNRLLLKNFAVTGFFMGTYQAHQPELVDEYLKLLYRWYDEGKLKPIVYREYAMDDLPEGLAAIEGRKSYGKVLIKL